MARKAVSERDPVGEAETETDRTGRRRRRRRLNSIC